MKMIVKNRKRKCKLLLPKNCSKHSKKESKGSFFYAPDVMRSNRNFRVGSPEPWRAFDYTASDLLSCKCKIT